MADLAALLEKEASAEIEQILSEARTRASEIVEGARAEAETLLASRKRSVEAQSAAGLVRARSAAQLEASSLTLRAQHDAIAAVFQEAEERIAALRRGPTYVEVLGQLMKEAVAASGSDPSEIRAVKVDPEDDEAARKAAKGLGLQDRITADPKVYAGVRVEAASDSAVIENTLPGRLAALRGELAAEVAQVLLSKEG
ncbi:MAG TPA: V-type ATP synthase subunit E [Trueperaceae bacterium]